MKKEDIEIRSERVRDIIEEKPPIIVRYGIMIISILILGLWICAYYIPYYETITVEIRFEDNKIGMIDVPYKYINSLKCGMSVSINFEENNINSYGTINAKVVSITTVPRQTPSGIIFSAQVKIGDCKFKVTPRTPRTASILVRNKSILQKIVQSTFGGHVR